VQLDLVLLLRLDHRLPVQLDQPLPLPLPKKKMNHRHHPKK
jgi:hypothetical protein